MTASGHAGHARAVSFVLKPDFQLAPGPRPLPTTAADGDWSLLALDRELGAADRTIPLLRGLAAPGTALRSG